MPSGVYIRTKEMYKSRVGRKVSLETRLKLSASLKGRVFSEEHIKKLSKVAQLRKYSDETRKKMSLSKKGKKLSPACIEKLRKIWDGRIGTKQSPEWCANISKGKLAKHVKEAPEVSSRRAELLRGRKLTPEHAKKCTAHLIGKKHTAEHTKHILAKVCARPNKFETFCAQYLEGLFPGQFVYCGDGSRIINLRSPDFVCEEIKTVVLCHGLYWHLFKFGLKNTQEDRNKVELHDSIPFLSAGYEVWFIWENYPLQVNNKVSIV